ncbi:MAG: glycosyltransferase [Ginsengibacter sp.]
MDEELLHIGKHTTTISVIIPARDEEQNISRCLKSVLQQDYDINLFEVIIIDDHSTDQTASIAKSLSQENLNIIALDKILINNTINSYKKRAIEVGISIAKGELIVCTDADCIAPKKWLQTIAGFYEHTNAEFISAPVKFHDITGKGFFKRLLYIFQTLDFTSLQGIGGAATASGFHYMCNGANLAFTKKSFFEVGGYKDIDDIASGDDMLLMEKFADAYPGKVKFIKSREAIIETAPALSLKTFIRQRIRWASKAGKYKTSSTKIVLATVYLLNVLLILTAILCFFNSNYLLYFLSAVILKTAFEIWFLLPVAHFFKNKSLLVWFIPAVPFHIIYTVIAGAFGMFGKYEWKGRVVK